MESKPSLSLKINGKTLILLKSFGIHSSIFSMTSHECSSNSDTGQREVGGALVVSAVSAQASLKLCAAQTAMNLGTQGLQVGDTTSGKLSIFIFVS